MSKKYESLAQSIVEKVGGIENINNVYHCTTWLRFTLTDDNKADKDALETMNGVVKVMISQTQFFIFYQYI